jgi:hypothetical protein
VTTFPAPLTLVADRDLAFRQHEGGHTPGPNWPYFLDFAARYFEPEVETKDRVIPDAKRDPGPRGTVRIAHSEVPALRYATAGMTSK